MNLEPGARVGPFEIVARIGGGGMGEVFRARDRKLNRDVALKVLPSAFASDPERMARFEREAQAVAALSHPNVLAIHDFGTADGVTYAVLELLDGSTLRERLDSGPLAPRRAIEFAIQIASGLAAAHDKGIVHRDLKPENIFITADQQAKILDFGIAKLAPLHPVLAEASVLPTTPINTAAGAVLGTIGYLSPEQVRGAAVDHRSDLFAFGAVLYEMLAGQPAFVGDSAVERMNAILKEEPREFDATAAVPAAVQRIIRRCLEKNPGNRFRSAHDLRFALENVTVAVTESHLGAPADSVRRVRRRGIAVRAAVVIGLMAMGAAAGFVSRGSLASSRGVATPTFTRLTDQRGTLRAARFGGDTNTVIYSAAWDGQPLRLYLARAGSSASTPLDVGPAHLLSISRSGELAMSLGHRFDGWLGNGTLARAPLLGTGPRPLLEGVRDADWSPDSSALAIVRRVDGRDRLEWPTGKVLYQTNGFITDPRFSPDGRRIAFVDHPSYGDNDGNIALIDTDGNKRDLLSGLVSIHGMAWSSRGDELWFAAATRRDPVVTLRAVDLSSGGTRVLLPGAIDVALMDVGRDGRVLLSRESGVRHTELTTANDPSIRDYSFSENSVARMASDDGSMVLITAQGPSSVYLRRRGDPTPFRLGDGEGYDLSPDGRWALSVVATASSRVLILPTGPGDAKELPNPQRLSISAARFLPDGRRIVLLGGAAGDAWRGYVQEIDSGTIRPFTAAGLTFIQSRNIVLTPDGTGAVFTAPDGRVLLFPTEGGEPRPIPHLQSGEFPLAWTPDARQFYVTRGSTPPWRIERVDVATGQRTLWKEVAASQSAGVRLSIVAMSPTGSTLVHSYSQLLSTLYLVEGIQ